MVQMCAAGLFGFSQPLVSRIRRCILPLLDEVLILDEVSLAEAIAQGEPVFVDGMFIRTGNRPASGNGKDLFSGKHNIQVAGTTYGDLIAHPPPTRRIKTERVLVLCLRYHDAASSLVSASAGSSRLAAWIASPI